MIHECSEKEQRLLDLLRKIPPDLTAAEQLLQEVPFRAEEVTKTALAYADDCFLDSHDWAQEHGDPPIGCEIPGLGSSGICDVLRLLLRFGLDPNRIMDGDNIMAQLFFVDNGYLAADALALLLGHGGDPDLFLPEEGETLFSRFDFDVLFGAVEQECRWRYVSTVHCWMVLLGCSAQLEKRGGIRLFREYDFRERFDLKRLRNHRAYDFSLIHGEEGFAVSIYDKATLWEVAHIR